MVIYNMKQFFHWCVVKAKKDWDTYRKWWIYWVDYVLPSQDYLKLHDRSVLVMSINFKVISKNDTVLTEDNRIFNLIDILNE